MSGLKRLRMTKKYIAFLIMFIPVLIAFRQLYLCHYDLMLLWLGVEAWLIYTWMKDK